MNKRMPVFLRFISYVIVNILVMRPVLGVTDSWESLWQARTQDINGLNVNFQSSCPWFFAVSGGRAHLRLFSVATNGCVDLNRSTRQNVRYIPDSVCAPVIHSCNNGPAEIVGFTCTKEIAIAQRSGNNDKTSTGGDASKRSSSAVPITSTSPQNANVYKTDNPPKPMVMPTEPDFDNTKPLVTYTYTTVLRQNFIPSFNSNNMQMQPPSYFMSGPSNFQPGFLAASGMLPQAARPPLLLQFGMDPSNRNSGDSEISDRKENVEIEETIEEVHGTNDGQVATEHHIKETIQEEVQVSETRTLTPQQRWDDK